MSLLLQWIDTVRCEPIRQECDDGEYVTDCDDSD
jgi:hypothetical protein